jgi:hypothetical protein
MMEWSRIEQKWLDMAVRLQAGTRVPATGRPNPIFESKKDLSPKPDADTMPIGDDTSARLIA